MASALDSLRQQILAATPVETADGLVCIISSGRKGVRLVVDRETGHATASNGNRRETVTNSDPALAAIRALSLLVTGGIA